MASLPNGPWVVAQTIPASIYTIPANSPSHHVTYVTIEDDDEDNDEWVTFAHMAGYTGLMIGWGCARWGSGWYYPLCYGGGIYYPGFHSHGYAAGYKSWTGHMPALPMDRTAEWARGRDTTRAPAPTRAAPPRGGYGAAGRRWVCLQPAHRCSWNDAPGLERLRQLGIDRRPARRRLGSHQSHHESRDGKHHASDTADDGAAVSRNTPGAGGSYVAKSNDGDVYAGRDGNVYRKDGDNWQKNDNGNWSDADRPTANTASQLEKDRTARREPRKRATTATPSAAPPAAAQRARVAAVIAAAAPAAAAADAGAETICAAIDGVVRARVEQLAGRIEGPFMFRFVCQPLVAVILAIRAGVADAQDQRAPYLWSVLTDSLQRLQR